MCSPACEHEGHWTGMPHATTGFANFPKHQLVSLLIPSVPLVLDPDTFPELKKLPHAAPQAPSKDTFQFKKELTP